MRRDSKYTRGAFLAGEPSGDRTDRVIPFRFNPESLSRQLTVEAGQTPPGTEGAAPPAGGDQGQASADAAQGSLKESFSVQIRVDLADRDEHVGDLDPQYGVAPEIAAIEELVQPVETDADATSDGGEAVRARRPRPAVLFVWGEKRVLPVRIASLTINESLFNAKLYPVRAEIEVALEVLGEAEARDTPGARAALDHTAGSRRQLARMYYENTAAQGSEYPRPGERGVN